MSLYDVHVGKLLNGKRDFAGEGYYIYSKDSGLLEAEDWRGSKAIFIDQQHVEELLFQFCCDTIQSFASTDENEDVYVFSLYTDITHGSYIIYLNTEKALNKTTDWYDQNNKKKFLETNDPMYACSRDQTKNSLRFSEGDFDFCYDDLPKELADMMSVYYCMNVDEQYAVVEQSMAVPKKLMDHQLYFIGIRVIKRLTEQFKKLDTTSDFIAYVSSAESGDYLTYSTLMRKTIELERFYHVFPDEKANDEEFDKIVQEQMEKSPKEQLDFWLGEISRNKWRTNDNVISKYCKTDYHAYESLVHIGGKLLPCLHEKLNEKDLPDEEREYCEELIADCSAFR